MPIAPPRPCARCGKAGCTAHPVPTYRDTKSSEEAKFYGSTLWKRTRAAHRQQEPLCRECMKAGVTRLGDMVDHIVRIRDGGNPTDPSNLQTMCDPHHNAKRQRERNP